MKRACTIAVAAVTCLAPALATAQGGRGGMVASGQPAGAAQAAGGGGRVWVGAVETKTVTGRPYSAEAVTERTQVLGDGNRINVRSVTKVFRDGEGRTRREMIDDSGKVRTISISDPVAKTSYTLNPETKIAYAAGGNIVAMRSPSGTATYTATPSTNATAGGGGGRGGTARVVEPVRVTDPSGETRVYMREASPDDPNTKKEDLGQQNIEGVMATGTRTTTVIPAGEIGNAQEIRIVSEQWFSDDLQVLVMTRHNDPRSGENVYRLQNILRAEPDQTLFSVPTDYTIQQRGIRRPQ
jgi:hypothetical protein